MAAYLCVWKVKGVFRWGAQASEAAASWAGNEIERRWSVGNNRSIPAGSRIFLKTSGNLKPGLICSGTVVPPPRDTPSIHHPTAVFKSFPYRKDGTEELDLPQDRVNFVQIRFDVI